MNKRLLLIAAFAMALCALDAAPKKTVLIVPDCITSGINLSTAQACSAFVRTIMLKDGRFSVVERKYMLSILHEHQLQMTGLTDSSNRKMLGKILAADKFFVVFVSRVGGISMVEAEESFLVKLEFIDLETGEIEIGETETVGGIANILPAVEKLAKKVQTNLPVITRVTAASDGRLYLAAGNKQGVKEGYKYHIRAQTKVVKNQQGKIVFKKKEIVGTLKITAVNADDSEGEFSSNGDFTPVEKTDIEMLRILN
mgnify:CR=1 FL=1